jgi:hypothetical protein
VKARLVEVGSGPQLCSLGAGTAAATAERQLLACFGIGDARDDLRSALLSIIQAPRGSGRNFSFLAFTQAAAHTAKKRF